MQKELNPHLFGETSMPQRVVEKPMTGTSIKLEKKVMELEQRIESGNANLKKVVMQMNEHIKATQSELVRLASSIEKLTKNDQTIADQVSAQIGQLHQRVAERKLMDQKVQELVDRHNAVLRSFEVRLSNLQQLINEKDAQMISSQAALNEAKMEIARLKRF